MKKSLYIAAAFVAGYLLMKRASAAKTVAASVAGQVGANPYTKRQTNDLAALPDAFFNPTAQTMQDFVPLH